jgi:hypothetical protein
MMNADLTKMWARIQDDLLTLIDHAEALQQSKSKCGDQPVAKAARTEQCEWRDT